MRGAYASPLEVAVAPLLELGTTGMVVLQPAIETIRMRVSSSRTFVLSDGILPEPIPDVHRLVLWVPGARENGFQHWDRISTLARAASQPRGAFQSQSQGRLGLVQGRAREGLLRGRCRHG